MKKETFESRLKSYIALTSSLLAIQQTNSNAQIIYSDRIPDDSISYSFFNLDLNNDGIADFKFEEEPFVSSTQSYNGYTTTTNYWFKNDVIPYNQNKVLAATGNNRPAHLISGEIISQNQNWISGENMQSPYFGGPWNVDSVGYLGLKITVGSNLYYGWTRIKITEDEMILYDYAYNAFPNQPILAGQGIVNSLPVLLNENSISIYPNPTTDNLNIQLNAPVTNGSIILTNTLGEVVYTVSINQQSKIINLKSLPAGLYFVEVVTDKGSVVKKVVKE